MNILYLNNDILYIIFNKLFLKSMIYFNHVNSLLYNTFSIEIKKYIYKKINTDYNLFFILLKMYNYEKNIINKMGLKIINDIKPIKTNNDKLYYDLRYLFEIINYGYWNNNIKDTRLYLIMIAIKRCISFNRYETIMNIYNEPILFALRRTIKIKEPNKWEPIKQNLKEII